MRSDSRSPHPSSAAVVTPPPSAQGVAAVPRSFHVVVRSTHPQISEAKLHVPADYKLLIKVAGAKLRRKVRRLCTADGVEINEANVAQIICADGVVIVAQSNAANASAPQAENSDVNVAPLPKPAAANGVTKSTSQSHHPAKPRSVQLASASNMNGVKPLPEGAPSIEAASADQSRRSNKSFGLLMFRVNHECKAPQFVVLRSNIPTDGPAVDAHDEAMEVAAMSSGLFKKFGLSAEHYSLAPGFRFTGGLQMFSKRSQSQVDITIVTFMGVLHSGCNVKLPTWQRWDPAKQNMTDGLLVAAQAYLDENPDTLTLYSDNHGREELKEEMKAGLQSSPSPAPSTPHLPPAETRAVRAATPVAEESDAAVQDLYREGLLFYAKGLAHSSPQKLLQEAQRIFESPALREHAGAICYRGRLMLPSDTGRAMALFMDSAARNHGPGCYWVGLCYKYGMAVSENTIDAQRWFDAAYSILHPLARAGDAESQFWLAEMYFNGQGLEPNEYAGIKWYSESCKNGFMEARYWVEKLRLEFPQYDNLLPSRPAARS